MFHVHRQPEARQQRCHARQQPGLGHAASGAQGQRSDHPERHRLAVQKLETGRGLYRVTNRVAEVENRAPAALALVSDNHLHLDPHRSLDELGQHSRRHGRARLRLQRIEHGCIGDEPGLDHLGHPGGEFARRQRSEEPQIGHHHPRLVKGADQVLAGGNIHPGLPAHRSVHHGQKGGRASGVRDPAQVDGGDKTSMVAGGAAPDSHESSAPIIAVAGQPIAGALDGS